MENLTSELLFSTSNSAQSQQLSRLVKSQRARKLAPRLYTTNMTDKPEQIIRHHWLEIVAFFYPGAVISHRTSFNGGSISDGVLFITSNKNEVRKLPGLTIRSFIGPAAEQDDTPMPEGLFLSSPARFLLENCQPSKTRTLIKKTVEQEQLESYLEKQCTIHGEEKLNELRDRARILAEKWGDKTTYCRLNGMIGAILNTHPHKLQSSTALARQQGYPYDKECVYRLDTLAHHLRQGIFPTRLFNKAGDAWINIAFFDAYFSNYIEGTRFKVEEAEAMIFNGKQILSRPKDSHDILATYRLVSNSSLMSVIPEDFNKLETRLKADHLTMMSVREEVSPGTFKETPNYAGNTTFVQPDYVRGTLKKGLEYVYTLKDAFSRAAMLMFVVADVHPFNDGNGRIARLYMNKALCSAGETRIVIPTVYREDYLLSLRKLTREGDPAPYVRMLQKAQQFTHEINWASRPNLVTQLKQCQAFLEPSEGKLTLP